MRASVNSEYLNNSLQALIQAIEDVNKTGSIITQIDAALISTLETLLSCMLTAKFNAKAGFMIDLDGASVQRPPQIHDPVQADLDFDRTIHSILDSGIPFCINTGRPAIFVRNIFPTTITDHHRSSSHFMVSTEYGACIRGHTSFEMISSLPNKEELSKIFFEAAQGHPGAVFERGKEHSIAISCANARDKQRAFDKIYGLAKHHADIEGNFHVIGVMKPDDAYVELVNPYIHKGVATDLMCARITSTHGPRQFFAFGDTNPDIPMWEEIKKHGGVSIGVGETAPEGADFYIPNHMVTQLLLRQVSLG